MNFQQFKVWREQLLQQFTPMRLDCMNPFIAMQFVNEEASSPVSCSRDELIERWCEVMQQPEWRGYALPTRGVRTGLLALFHLFAQQHKSLYLPNDIYPFYHVAAQQAGLHQLAFNSWPDVDWSVLSQAGPDSVLLLTNPQNPSGQYLNQQQLESIASWLADFPQRRIVLDTVYCYDAAFDAATQALWQTGQCFICHSLSKAWLSPNCLGVVMCPDAERAMLQPLLALPEPEACRQAARALHKLDLPQRQQQVFHREWQRLLPLIQRFSADFTPPDTGYFAIVHCDFDTLLNQHRVLTIPASVFGIDKAGWSVISCLYEIKRYQEERI